ncbi:flagellar protein FlaG [Pseudomonas sp. GD04087]|uniref:flagellar protein FlaG n=1 Tax=Pseudomonas TaxID=286 RepID=UPI001F2C8D7B|nr:MULTISPECIES: flagellar protein FlaG [Pseudomonas]MCP1651234.1 flagellar protein FlaG [Pseudomonas nitroreducens]MCP1684241.1 flagellar protein FlaG [Pseudomonas nitroreducens]MDH0292956.1 flagellar protein FlaG [Pseudomonas sp. GD04087]MDH1051175.1 flagellar protein FlaG [Pseudomonas sp. GD03903]MDH1998441.1 flagellar protein FlaG [Pseudomonas sp. GD03691]
MDIVNIASTSLLGNARGTATPNPTGTPRAAGEVQPADAASAADKRGQIDSAVKSMQSYAQSVTRNLNFSIDDSTGEVVVKVIDGESGKVVRQIPSEEVLKLAAQLDDMRSLMFEAQA